MTRLWNHAPRRGLVALLLFTLWGCSGPPADEVWVIGLDGADWDLLDPMIARGELPHLASLRQDGAYGVLRSDEPMLSPILWTSIATGKTADLHGVTWFMSDAPDGTKIPVSSRNRWVRAVWNIASEREVPVGVVGWWATWPAEPVDGFVVSDYVAWHSFGVTGREFEAPGKTHPPELQDRVQEFFPAPESIDNALLQTMVHLPPERLGFDAAAGPFGGPITHLRQAIATTIGYTDLTLHLLEEERPRFLAVYYEGTDAVEHLFSRHMSPRLPWISEEDHAAYKDVVEAYWRWQDQQLGRLLAQRGPNTTVVVISDHGFRIGDERLKEDEFQVETADASHMPDGIVVLNGPPVRKGARIRGADIYDVTPHVLHLLGLPVAEDMKGSPWVDALDPAWKAEHPVQTIPTYETGDWDRGDDLVVDAAAGESMEEMLRSLGYISGGNDGDDAGATPATGNVEQGVNMAVVLRQQGRYAEAASQLETILADQPGHVEARSNLARVYAEMDRLPDAEALYADLVAESPDDLRSREDWALALARLGRFDDALDAYDTGLQQDPDWATGLAGKGFALHQLGRSQEGLTVLDKAVEADPRMATAHYYRGTVLRTLGRPADARRALERAVQLDPTNPAAVVLLSVAREEAGDAAGALQLVERVRNQGVDDPDLRAQAGALYLKAGRLPEAVAELSAVADILDDPQVYGNYGTALGMGGDLAGAARNFEKVVEKDPDSVEGIGTLAQIHMQMQRPEKAETLLTDAVRRIPDAPMLRMNLGTLYHGLNRLDDAEREYRKAIELDDSVGVFYYQLAMLMGQRGQEADARELVRKARELDPSLPDPERP